MGVIAEVIDRLTKIDGEEWLLYAGGSTTVLAIILLCYCVVRAFLHQGHEDPSTPLHPESWCQSGHIYMTKDIVAIDCETVTCNTTEEWRMTARNPKTQIQPIAARYAIVDYDLNVICQGYISPPLKVEKWKGLEDDETNVEQREDFYVARKKILGVLRGKRVVAHHYQHDLFSLKIDDFPKEDIRDTSKCEELREKAKMDPTEPHMELKELAKRIFGENIQPKRHPHDPVIDAKMAMRLYKHVEREWEKRLQKSNRY